MERLWAALGDHAGTRTLVFCCSIAHAEFAKRWLEERGVRVRAVHSEPASDDRSQALTDLTAGQIDAVCAVDLFNEGVDLPLVDRVVMLRPTESPSASASAR
jgi:superfamily II DNA or RNA helicase